MQVDWRISASKLHQQTHTHTQSEMALCSCANEMQRRDCDVTTQHSPFSFNWFSYFRHPPEIHLSMHLHQTISLYLSFPLSLGIQRTLSFTIWKAKDGKREICIFFHRHRTVNLPNKFIHKTKLKLLTPGKPFTNKYRQYFFFFFLSHSLTLVCVCFSSRFILSRLSLSLSACVCSCMSFSISILSPPIYSFHLLDFTSVPKLCTCCTQSVAASNEWEWVMTSHFIFLL